MFLFYLLETLDLTLRPLKSSASKNWTALRKPGKIRSVGRFVISLPLGQRKNRKETAIKKLNYFAFTEGFLCKSLTVFMNFMYSCKFLMKVHFSRWLKVQKTTSLSMAEYVLNHQRHFPCCQLMNYFRRKKILEDTGS